MCVIWIQVLGSKRKNPWRTANAVNTCLLPPLQPIHWTANQHLLPKSREQKQISPRNKAQHGPASCQNTRTVSASSWGNNFPSIFNFSAEGCQAGGGTREPPTERISPTLWETWQKSLLVWPALAIYLVIKFKRTFYFFEYLSKSRRVCFQCCQPAVLALPRHLTAIT